MKNINPNTFEILVNPVTGEPLSEEVYEITSGGVIVLNNFKQEGISERVYSSTEFSKWNKIVNERINYYTKKSTIAGRVARYSYKSIGKLEDRNNSEYLLDIGCGDGSQLEFLVNKSNYIGLDRNLDRLEILKKNYPEATAIYGDASLLPFKNNSIKHIFSSNAFEHIWDLKDATLEIYRCMQKDGSGIIVIPTEGGLWNLGRQFLSKPHFTKIHPEINFDFISKIEHCNDSRQVIHTLKTFFDTRNKYLPLSFIPSIFCNLMIEISIKKNNCLDLSA